MRRGSVIAPLILIVIGALFLLRNFWPEIPMADFISKYWPLVLITWGGIRLVEILAAAIMNRPIPKNGVSGGEWMLVFLICIVGGTLYTARHYTAWFPAGRVWREMARNMGESYDYTLASVDKPCVKNCRILIENFRGNAKITGSNDLTVKASGRQSIRSLQQVDAENASKQTKLELIQDGDQMIVRTNQDRITDRSQVTADLEITVPMGSSVEARGRLGDFDIQNITGAVDINSDNAGVRLENIGGDVKIDLRRSDIIRATDVKGSVDLKGRGQDVELQNIAGQVTVGGTYTGQIQLRNLEKPLRYENPQVTLNLEKLPGQVHMAQGELTASNIIGPIRVNASRALDVQLSDFSQSLELTLERGDIELRPGKTVPKIEVHTRSGDLDLALLPGAKFDLKASTDHGEVHNDFGSPLTVDENNRGAAIGGVSGASPQPVLRLETGRGAVTVRKAGMSEDVTFPDLPNAPKPPQAPKAPIKQ